MLRVCITHVMPYCVDIYMILLKYSLYLLSAFYPPILPNSFEVEPQSLSPIFSIDEESGELSIDGRGPNLVGGGDKGILTVHKIL